jgi:Flp pilus assembly protein TadD
MPSFRERLEGALALSLKGNHEEAIAALNACLQEASDANDERWIRHFARNLGIVLEQAGDLLGAEGAYLRLLALDGADPTVHVALAICTGGCASTRLLGNTSRGPSNWPPRSETSRCSR